MGTLYWWFTREAMRAVIHRWGIKDYQVKVFNEDMALKNGLIAAFSKVELREYEDSLKAYRDIKNSLDTAKAEGLAEGFGKGRVEGHAEGRAEGLVEGRAEGRAETLVEVAKNLLSIGTPIESIMKATGMTEDEIKDLA